MDRSRVEARRSRAALALSLASLPALLAGLPARAADDSLSPVVVTGTRSEKALDETPIRTEVVTRTEIERMNSRTLKQALENVPGLQLREIHGKSGYEVSMQGLTSDQVLVLIDGLPITASTGSTVDLSQYLLNEVERIEVVKGASSAQYGSSAMGGVINVITRRIRPGYSGSVAVDVGSRGSQNPSGDSVDAATRHARFLLEGGSERWRLRVDGDVLKDDGFADDPDAWSRQGDEISREQFGGRIEWLPTSSSRLWVDGSTYREKDKQRFLYYAPPNQIPQRKHEDIDRDRIGIGGNWTGANGLRVELKGLEERYDSHSDGFSNEFLQRTRESSQRTTHVTGQVDLPAWKRQLWQFGVDWHRETLDQTNNGASELLGIGSTDRTSHEFFIQNDIVFDEIWEVILGFRWQDDSDFGSHAVPKVALRANLLRGADWKGSLLASYGHGYRVPNLKERHYLFDHSSLGYMVIGNPDLRPEESTSIQFGGRLDYRNELSIEANAFYNRVDDLIQIDETNATTINGISVFTYRNVSRARSAGLETAVRWRASPGLDLSAAYTLTRTRDLDTGQDLTRRPRHIARAGVDWQALERTTLSLRARYQSSELVDSVNDERSPAWTTLDLALNHRIGRGTTAFVGIDNLFDKQRDFADASDFGPISGRFVYVGLRHEFGNN
ncbi:MAG TPA: TonB-dependent receptor [Burkholderiaceae bacterium]|nr:TonB-dependent receptor [Burkholderiaceae bacterium]